MSFIYLFLGRNRENVLEFKSVARDAKRWRDWEETGIVLFYFVLFSPGRIMEYFECK